VPKDFVTVEGVTSVLRDRYENEFRPYIIGDVARTDSTLKLWIDIFTS
jgi:hypothetical protein